MTVAQQHPQIAQPPAQTPITAQPPPYVKWIIGVVSTLLIHADSFDHRLVTAVKSVSAELRQLEVHRSQMRERDAQLMERDDHARILQTFARIVVDEINAWARSTPDIVGDALTEAGVKTNAKKVMRALDLALTTQADDLRTRIAEAVEQADQIE